MNYKIESHDIRYFLGIEKEGGITLGTEENLDTFWRVFLDEDIALLNGIKTPHRIIGLDCYPPDFGEQMRFDYYAMIEVTSSSTQPGFVSKKLPKGDYIVFDIPNQNIQQEIRKVYQYLDDKNIRVHTGFDYEYFGEDYHSSSREETLKFALLLKERIHD
jgi:predicted transcriptional regulator YdeE